MKDHILGRRNQLVSRLTLFLTVLMFGGTDVGHAVSVSPMAVYMDAGNRTATLTLYNPDSRPEEVEIGFAFGYPQSDLNGVVSVQLVYGTAESEPSAVPWLRAFPQRLVLQPGQSQVVRVLVQPPAGLENGEYWARVLVTGRGGRPPIEEVSGDVRVSVSLTTVVVASLAYRHGAVETGLRVAGTHIDVQDGIVELDLDLERMGNAAYLGRIHAELIGTNEDVIDTFEDDVAVYRTLRRRLVFTLPEGMPLPPGTRVRYSIRSNRPDLPQGAALPAAPVAGIVEVR